MGGGGGGERSDIVLLTALIAYLLFLFVPLETAAAAHTVSMINKQMFFGKSFLFLINNLCCDFIKTVLVGQFNPIALRKAKIMCNFGFSECNRVKNPVTTNVSMGKQLKLLHCLSSGSMCSFLKTIVSLRHLSVKDSLSLLKCKIKCAYIFFYFFWLKNSE